MEQEIENIVELIGEQLKNLESKLKKVGDRRTQIKIPEGLIGTANTHRRFIPFIIDDDLQSNIAYHLMLDRILYWFLKRFGVYLTIEQMLIKIAIVNIGNIIESVILHLAKRLRPEQVQIGFYRRLTNMVKRKIWNQKSEEKQVGFHKGKTILIKEKIIKRSIKKDLEWVWGIRCKQHLESLKKKEYEIYERKDYIKAQNIWNEFSDQLLEAGKKKKLVMKDGLWNLFDD